MTSIAMWPVEFKMSAKLTVVKPSAKQANSNAAIRYSLYKSGMTCAQYVAACEAKKVSSRIANSDLIWDSDRKFITIAGYTPTGASLPKKVAAKTLAPVVTKAKPAKKVAKVAKPQASLAVAQ